MRGWLGRIGWNTNRVFIVTLFAALVTPGMLLLIPVSAPSRVDDALFNVSIAMFAPVWAVVTVNSFVSDVLRVPGTLLSGLADDDQYLLMYPANAVPWATLMTTAYVLVRRVRERRAASREV